MTSGWFSKGRSSSCVTYSAAIAVTVFLGCCLLWFVLGTVTVSPLSTTAEGYIRCNDDGRWMHPPECPTYEDGTPTYFPYPYDCTKYFECTNGVAFCFKCPPTTVWDNKNKTCDHEATTECLIETTARPTQTTTTSPTTSSASTTTEDPANWICPESYEGLVGHPTNCKQFYSCIPGRKPALYDCPQNLYYNPETKECDWPGNVPGCQGATRPPPVN